MSENEWHVWAYKLHVKYIGADKEYLDNLSDKRLRRDIQEILDRFCDESEIRPEQETPHQRLCAIECFRGYQAQS